MSARNLTLFRSVIKEMWFLTYINYEYICGCKDYDVILLNRATLKDVLFSVCVVKEIKSLC